MDSLLPSDPSSIDGYVIEGRLGSGGFGIVYGATSPDGRPVAVKVLRPELSDDLRLRERLAREADALSRVEGHRTAEIFEVVTEGDLVCLVMERVEGESLTDQVNADGQVIGVTSSVVTDANNIGIAIALKQLCESLLICEERKWQ